MDTFIVFAMHCIADFPMQGEYLSKAKTKSIYVLFCHCAIYTLFMSIGFGGIAYMYGAVQGISWGYVLMLLFYSHFAIDYVKGYFEVKLPVEVENEERRIREKRMMLFYCDQALHLAIAYAILETCIR